MTSANHSDLAAFGERTAMIERQIVAEIEAHGAPIRRHDSLAGEYGLTEETIRKILYK